MASVTDGVQRSEAQDALAALVASGDLLTKLGQEILTLATSLRKFGAPTPAAQHGQSVPSKAPARTPPRTKTPEPDDEVTDSGIRGKPLFNTEADLPKKTTAAPPAQEDLDSEDSDDPVPTKDEAINFVLEVVKRQGRVGTERFTELKKEALRGATKKGSEYTDEEAVRLFRLVRQELEAQEKGL